MIQVNVIPVALIDLMIFAAGHRGDVARIVDVDINQIGRVGCDVWLQITRVFHGAYIGRHRAMIRIAHAKARQNTKRYHSVFAGHSEIPSTVTNLIVHAAFIASACASATASSYGGGASPRGKYPLLGFHKL